MIDFQNLNVSSDIPRREFVNNPVTIVKAKSVNLSYFHLDDVAKLPNNMFETSKADAPFTVMQLETDDLDERIHESWNFSLSNQYELDQIFNDVSDVHVQQWPYISSSRSQHYISTYYV